MNIAPFCAGAIAMLAAEGLLFFLTMVIAFVVAGIRSTNTIDRSTKDLTDED